MFNEVCICINGPGRSRPFDWAGYQQAPTWTGPSTKPLALECMGSKVPHTCIAYAAGRGWAPLIIG